MINFLFEINPEYNITEINKDYIIIDNFYKNYEDLSNYAKDLKKDIRTPNIENYKNCRTSLTEIPDSYKTLIKLIEDYSIKYFNRVNKVITNQVTLNSITLYKDYPDNIQHWPHIDNGTTGIIYLSEEDSGTVIYKDNDIKFPVGNGYFRDISNLEIEKIIDAKPNRLVILNAVKIHGSYFYKKILNKERISQIVFTI